MNFLKTTNLYSAIAVSILFRAVASRFPYSGRADAPRFGDFEAQRHWLELTLNLPINQWYVYSSHWDLDYPPLSAYLSFLFAKLFYHIDPSVVEFVSSRGLESDTCVMLMRLSVLAVDLLLYYPSVLLVVKSMPEFRNIPVLHSKAYKTKVLHILFNPTLILMDHAHFQYNHVVIALLYFAVSACMYRKLLIAAFLFSVSILFKQTALYYAPAFFAYLLKECIAHQTLKITIKKRLLLLTKIGLTVLLTFCAVLSPFRYFFIN